MTGREGNICTEMRMGGWRDKKRENTSSSSSFESLCKHNKTNPVLCPSIYCPLCDCNPNPIGLLRDSGATAHFEPKWQPLAALQANRKSAWTEFLSFLSRDECSSRAVLADMRSWTHNPQLYVTHK